MRLPQDSLILRHVLCVLPQAHRLRKASISLVLLMLNAYKPSLGDCFVKFYAFRRDLSMAEDKLQHH